MNIKLIEVSNQGNEMFFDIYDEDLKEKVGILFTMSGHIAYEIKPEFRCRGMATEALRKVLQKIDRPILEITFSNVPSIKVAKKLGFSLKRTEGEFGIYERDSLKR